jgi:hypothetical protein
MTSKIFNHFPSYLSQNPLIKKGTILSIGLIVLGTGCYFAFRKKSVKNTSWLSSSPFSQLFSIFFRTSTQSDIKKAPPSTKAPEDSDSEDVESAKFDASKIKDLFESEDEQNLNNKLSQATDLKEETFYDIKDLKEVTTLKVQGRNGGSAMIECNETTLTISGTGARNAVENSDLTDFIKQLLVHRRSGVTKVNFGGQVFLSGHSIQKIVELFPNLEEVDFSQCKGLTNQCVMHLTQCSNLRKINFASCSQITDNVIVALSKGCPNLEEVNFTLCYRLGDHSVKALAQNCKKLRVVNFNCCGMITDASVIELAQNCSTLEEVNFNLPPIYTDESRRYYEGRVANYLKDLEQLNRDMDQGGGDPMIYVLINKCPNWNTLRTSNEKFNFDMCKNLTKQSVEALGKNCSKLTTINIDHCKDITEEFIQFLSTNYPNLTEISSLDIKAQKTELAARSQDFLKGQM